MNSMDIKKEIIQKVEKLSDEQLIQVNNFVDNINEASPKEYDLLAHIDTIMLERSEVLKKLAE